MTVRLKPSAGEWVRLPRKHDQVCCDCGLWHRVEVKLVKGKLWMRAWRSEAQTAGKRSAKKRAGEGVFKSRPKYRLDDLLAARTP